MPSHLRTKSASTSARTEVLSSVSWPEWVLFKYGTSWWCCSFMRQLQVFTGVMFAAYWCLSLESLLARPSLLWFIALRRHWVSLSLTGIISHSCPDFVPVLMSDNSEAIKQNTLNMTGLKCNLHVVQTMKDYSLLQVFFWLWVLFFVFICKAFSYIGMYVSKHTKMIIYESS